MVNFSYYYFADLLPGFLIITLGIYALVKNPNDTLNRILFCFSLPIFFRGVIEPVFRTSNNLSEAIAWNAWRAPTLFLIMPMLLHFCIVFYRKKNISNPFFYLLLYGPPIVQSVVSNLTPLIDRSYYRSYYGVFSAPGDWYTYSYLIIMLYMALSMVFAYLAYRQADDQFVKKQAAFIMLGTISPALVGTVTDLILPLLGYQWVGMITFSSLFITVFFFIAITRYRLAHIAPLMAINAISYAIPDAMLISRTSGELIYRNRLASQLLGEPMVNINIKDFAQDRSIEDNINDLLGKGFPSYRISASIKRTDGRSIPADISSSIIKSPEGRSLGILWGIRSLATDIQMGAELSRKKLDLQEKVNELERMNEIMKDRDLRLAELRSELGSLKAQS